MHKIIQPILPYNLIQEIRLAQALMESSFGISIPSHHAYKFERLRDKFNAVYHVEAPSSEPFCSLKIDHNQPVTQIGSIGRPLVFPHAITKYCRSVWGGDRKTLVSFSGLMTPSRIKVIDKFCQSNFGTAITPLLDSKTFYHRIRSKARKIFGKDVSSYSVNVGDLTLSSSQRGRYFPVKAWDDDYIDLLSRSKFVLCPSGSSVWSYRFFESALCGAIPIVEDACEAYEGFIYYTMDDELYNLDWSMDMALHNYNLCSSRITIPVEEIDSELYRITFRS